MPGPVPEPVSDTPPVDVMSDRIEEQERDSGREKESGTQNEGYVNTIQPAHFTDEKTEFQYESLVHSHRLRPPLRYHLETAWKTSEKN